MFNWMVVPQEDGSCHIVEVGSNALVATVHPENDHEAILIAALMSASSILLSSIVKINNELHASKHVISLETVSQITARALEKIMAEAGVEGNL